MDYSEKINQIKEFLGEPCSDEEKFLLIKDLLPKEIVYIEKEPKTSKKQLEYMKAWRLEQKKFKTIREKEAKEAQKINTALKREKGFCFHCKEAQNIINPSHKIVLKTNRTKKQILVISECPKCQNLIKSHGGYL